MEPRYRHTQFGWVTLGSIGVGAPLVTWLAAGRQLPGAFFVVLPLLLVGLLFASLTVEVRDRELRVAFTGGVIHKRFPLSELRRCTAVRNPWYYGWGIHRLRGGWIWNVSGFGAVELVLADGSLWRIGTDEPTALARAIAAAAPATASQGGHSRDSGPNGDSTASQSVPVSGGPWRAALVAAVVCAGVALLVLPFRLQMRDPRVTLGGQRLSIDSLFYGQDYALADVRAVSLETRLPRVLARTNGFAGGGRLRGWFDVEGHGRCKLFVDAGNAPFVLLHLRGGDVFVNFSDPERTRALYEQLRAALQDR